MQGILYTPKDDKRFKLSLAEGNNWEIYEDILHLMLSTFLYEEHAMKVENEL